MLDLLIREAEALALPCFDLVPATGDDQVIAYWGGSRSDLPGDFAGAESAYRSRKHVVSVDPALWKTLGLEGRGPFSLAIYTDRDGNERPDIVPDRSESWKDITFDAAVPLKAIESVSLPPLEAVILYGGPTIDDLLKEQGLRRWEYSGLVGEDAEAYQSYFHERSPLMMDVPPFARAGGWHVLWCDDDFYIPREMRLMLWTFEDSEPWYEVFLTPQNNHHIKERIT